MKKLSLVLIVMMLGVSAYADAAFSKRELNRHLDELSHAMVHYDSSDNPIQADAAKEIRGFINIYIYTANQSYKELHVLLGKLLEQLKIYNKYVEEDHALSVVFQSSYQKLDKQLKIISKK